jgi:hypothetical protein
MISEAALRHIVRSHKINMAGTIVAGCHVIAEGKRKPGTRGAIWIARCGCGNTIEVPGFQLRQNARRGYTYRCAECSS